MVTTEDSAANPAIRAVAALDDGLRRGMYAFIRRVRRPVTRDEAAAEVGISEGHVRVIRHRALAKLRGCVMALRQAS